MKQLYAVKKEQMKQQVNVMFMCWQQAQVCTEDRLESPLHGGSRTSLSIRAVLSQEQGREAPPFLSWQSLLPFSPLCPGAIDSCPPTAACNTVSHKPDQLLFPSKREASTDAIYSSSSSLASVGKISTDFTSRKICFSSVCPTQCQCGTGSRKTCTLSVP